MDILNKLEEIQEQIAHLEQASWEYTTIETDKTEKDFDRKLNELGNEGWELVNVISAYINAHHIVKCIFKRRKF